MILDPLGAFHSVEASVEKDFTAALLARDLNADLFLLLTDTDGVWMDWGTKRAKLVRSASPNALRNLALERRSIGAKVEAACRFVEWTGRDAVIGAIEDAVCLLEGTKGTRVSAGVDGLRFEDATALAPVP